MTFRKRTTLHIFLFITSLLCTISVMHTHSYAAIQGDGTEESPYLISTLRDLEEFRYNVNNGNDYSGQYVKLMNDIVMNDDNIFIFDDSGAVTQISTNYLNNHFTWKPIGAESCFCGTFDGNGHIISGIVVSLNNGSYYSGLFGKVENAEIKNLELKRCYISGGDAGAIAGSAVSSIIRECIVSDSYIACSQNSADAKTGGLIGFASSSTITNCFNNNTYVYGSQSTSNKWLCIGGLIGHSTSSSIIECHNSGKIGGSYKAQSGSADVEATGGIVGRMQSCTISKCSNDGTVCTQGGNSGGIVGKAQGGSFNGCNNNGKVEGSYSGGITGHSENTSFFENSNNGKIEGGYSGGIAGSMYASPTSTNNYICTMCINDGPISGLTAAGGIVGKSKESINECCNRGCVWSTRFAGGIIGNIEIEEYYSIRTISYCYNSGFIGYSSTQSTGNKYVGGIIGQACGRVNVEKCFNAGELTDIGYNNYIFHAVGGIVGYSDCLSVKQCYNTGTFVGENNSYYTGVVGTAGNQNNNFVLSNSFCLYGVASALSPTAMENVMFLDENQMSFSDSFIGFDFENDWTMDGNPDYPYPELSCFSSVSLWIPTTGTEQDPYLIYTLEELEEFRDGVNDGRYMCKHTKLMNNLELNNNGSNMYEWTPIESFIGTFDGNGFTISGITDTLFKTVRYSVIINLGVTDSYITKSNAGIIIKAESSTVTNCYYTGTVNNYDYPYVSSDDYTHIGGIVATATSSVITDCYFDGSIGNNMLSTKAMGGIVGYADSSTITGCGFSGSVYDKKKDTYSAALGGIVGEARITTIDSCYNEGSINNGGGIAGALRGGKIIDCINTGSIDGAGIVSSVVEATIERSSNSGTINGRSGIAGEVSGGTTITDCYNTGSVEGKSFVGGIIGYASGSNGKIISITRCYNKGSIESSNASAGGIIGFFSINVPKDIIIQITECYNTGNVNGKDHTGGIIGSCSGPGIIDCCYNTGDITGTKEVGGIVGYSVFSHTIVHCFNAGSIKASSDCVGGIVGLFHVTTFTATISSCYNSGSIRGADIVGGIVGDCQVSKEASLNECYNAGIVLGTDSMAGIIGQLYTYEKAVNVTNCYYNADNNDEGIIIKNGATDYTISIENVCGRTDEQMKNSINFTGFDFDDEWTMEGNPNYQYPELIIMPHVLTEYIKGDVNGDGVVTSDDAVHLLYYTLLPDLYTVNQYCDFNSDGQETSDDAIYLLYYTLLPDLYPLS